MDAIVMCGGEGSRLGSDAEKPLYQIHGTPMIEYILTSLEESDINRIYSATSPQAPQTKSYVKDRTTVIETSGDDYFGDLAGTAASVRSPVLAVSADLPALTARLVNDLIREYNRSHQGTTATFCVPTGVKQLLGLSTDGWTIEVDQQRCSTVGVRIFADGDEDELYDQLTNTANPVPIDSYRIAVNVNYPSDASIAEIVIGG